MGARILDLGEEILKRRERKDEFFFLNNMMKRYAGKEMVRWTNKKECDKMCVPNIPLPINDQLHLRIQLNSIENHYLLSKSCCILVVENCIFDMRKLASINHNLRRKNSSKLISFVFYIQF